MKTEPELIQDMLDLIQKRPHNKKRLNTILSDHQGWELLRTLDHYFYEITDAEMTAFNYTFYNKHLKGKPDDSHFWDAMEKEIYGG